MKRIIFFKKLFGALKIVSEEINIYNITTYAYRIYADLFSMLHKCRDQRNEREKLIKLRMPI